MKNENHFLFWIMYMTKQILPRLEKHQLGHQVPQRHGKFSQKIAYHLMNLMGWKTVGEVPNISKAVVIGVPHTSNIDGLYALPALLALDIDIRIMGKKQLFDVPVLAQILRWAGVIPINRDKKGSVLQANIERFQQEEQLFLGLAPEGTRAYTEKWKTGFYYLALGAKVPILPVAMDYKTKELRFLPLFYPTGDIEQDLPQIYAYYQGVQGLYVENMSQPLQDLMRTQD